MKQEICWGCSKSFFCLCTPMRCHECVKNKVPIGTSPVSDAYWVLTTDPKQEEKVENGKGKGENEQ